MIHDEHDTSMARRAFERLLMVANALFADMAVGLEDRGLTQTRAHMLWELSIHPPMNQRELAAVLKVTPRNVTTLVDALERAAFVRRISHPSDRRSILIELTDKGAKAVKMLRSDRNRLADHIFDGFQENDLETFNRISEQVASRLAGLTGNEQTLKSDSTLKLSQCGGPRS